MHPSPACYATLMKHILIILAGLAPAAVSADPAAIVDATARQGAGGWTVSVTLRHADTGCDRYADWWEVITPGGELVYRRILRHSHVTEQPFTRSQSGIAIPEGTVQVMIRARTLTDGWSRDTMALPLP